VAPNLSPVMVISRQNQRRAAWGVAAYGAKKVGSYLGKRMVQSATRKSQSARTSSDVPRAMTFQHDSMVQYKRRKAPRKVVRRAKRSYKAFLKNEVKGLGLTSRNIPSTFASGLLTPTSYNNSQAIYTVGLYGGILNSITWGDLAAIATAESFYEKSGKLFFRTAILESQVRNNSATAVLVADVYTVAARKESYNDPASDWTLALTNVAVATGTTAVTPLCLGNTPFDAPGFGSSWIVLSKSTYRIGPGNSVYLTLKHNRKFVFDTDRFEFDTGAAVARMKMFKGISKGFIMVFRSADPVPATPCMGPVDYEIVNQKTYRYSMNAFAENSAGVQL